LEVLQENKFERESMALGAAASAGSGAPFNTAAGADVNDGEVASAVRQALPIGRSSSPRTLDESFVSDTYDNSPSPSVLSVEHLEGSGAGLFDNDSKHGSDAAASLKVRLAKLQGSMLLGSVLVDVAPMEAYVNTHALLSLLEFGLALQTSAATGDQTFSQCAPDSLGNALGSCALAARCPLKVPLPTSRIFDNLSPMD
jgi:hypothetical protein